jgi:hypothetical protein
MCCDKEAESGYAGSRRSERFCNRCFRVYGANGEQVESSDFKRSVDGRFLDRRTASLRAEWP